MVAARMRPPAGARHAACSVTSVASVGCETCPRPGHGRAERLVAKELTMKLSSSRDLFAHWNERRGKRMAPERGDIEPAAIRKVLGDTFILGAEPGAGYQ